MLWSVWGVCLLVLSGCATTSVNVAPNNNDTLLKEQASHATGDPVELAILSAISSMNRGERGAAGAVTYVVGDTYSAASGEVCKSVTIIRNASKGTRVACTNGQRWSFSSEVFLVDSHRD